MKTIGEVVDDPGTAERDMVVEADYGSLGTLRMFGQPIKLSATPATTGTAPRTTSPNTPTDVLTALAGYDADRIARAAGGGGAAVSVSAHRSARRRVPPRGTAARSRRSSRNGSWATRSPPAWEGVYFPFAVPFADLRPDGTPARDGVLPEIDLPRRMYAGESTEFFSPLRSATWSSRAPRSAASSRSTARADR